MALAVWAQAFYGDVAPTQAELDQHVTEAIRPALKTLAEKLAACTWDKASIAAAIKETISHHGIRCRTQSYAGSCLGHGDCANAVPGCGAGTAKSTNSFETSKKSEKLVYNLRLADLHRKTKS
ncbi:MAG: hypothetical protein R3E42_08595 [Burkholderiaceae bacterium]